MGPLIKTILAANGRIYDLAVAVYSVSGLAALAGTRLAGKAASRPDPSIPGTEKVKIPAKLAKLSLIVFVLGGVPRLLSFHAFEWRAAAGDGRAGALLVRIAVLFLLAAGGTLAWIRAGRKIKKLADAEPAGGKPVDE